MLNWLRNLTSIRPQHTSAGRSRFALFAPVRGKYDAAQTTPENRRHWANADGLSPNAALMNELGLTIAPAAPTPQGSNTNEQDTEDQPSAEAA